MESVDLGFKKREGSGGCNTIYMNKPNGTLSVPDLVLNIEVSPLVSRGLSRNAKHGSGFTLNRREFLFNDESFVSAEAFLAGDDAM